MTETYFIGDIHGGHQGAVRFRTQFASDKIMFDFIAENYHKVVTKRDVVYLTGDIAFTKEYLDQIKKWEGLKKYLVIGNHDNERKLMCSDFIEVFDEIYSMKKLHEFWITHAPIHPDELRGKKNIHGHTHNHNIDDPRYFNTSCENINFTPISIQDIRKRFKDMDTEISSTLIVEPEKHWSLKGIGIPAPINNDLLIRINKILDFAKKKSFAKLEVKEFYGSAIGTNSILFIDDLPFADLTDYDSW